MIAIKNSKITVNGDFLLVYSDQQIISVLAQGRAKTYRKIHQGSNHWDLWRVKTLQKDVSYEETSEGICLGRNYGQDNCVKFFQNFTTLFGNPDRREIQVRVEKCDLEKVRQILSASELKSLTDFSWFRGQIKTPTISSLIRDGKFFPPSLTGQEFMIFTGGSCEEYVLGYYQHVIHSRDWLWEGDLIEKADSLFQYVDDFCAPGTEVVTKNLCKEVVRKYNL